MMLSLCVVGAFAQNKAGSSLKEMNSGKTQKITLSEVKTPTATLSATADMPLSWKRVVQNSPQSPYGNGEASVAILVADGGDKTLSEMFNHDTSDIDYFKSNVIGEVFNVEKYYTKDSMRVVRIDTRRPENEIYYIMYYAEDVKGNLITMSCIVPDASNVSPRVAVKKYVPVFDAIVPTVNIQKTVRHIEKDTLYVKLNECVARIEAYKAESKAIKGQVSASMYPDSTTFVYFMMDAKNIASVMDSAVVDDRARANLMATMVDIQEMKVKSMTLSNFTNSNKLNVFLGIGSLEEKNTTKSYMLALVPYKNTLFGVKAVVEVQGNIAYYMDNMMFILKNVLIKEIPRKNTAPDVVPQVETLRVNIGGDSTRVLCVPLKKGWRGETDGKTKHTFVYMTQGENMGVVPTAWKYEDYTSPARREALCKSLEKSQEASSVRYKKCGDYDVFEIFKVKKGNPSPQKKDMHMFLMYGNGMRINVWYFCPVNTDVEKVSGKFEEMLKTWEVK